MNLHQALFGLRSILRRWQAIESDMLLFFFLLQRLARLIDQFSDLFISFHYDESNNIIYNQTTPQCKSYRRHKRMQESGKYDTYPHPIDPWRQLKSR